LVYKQLQELKIRFKEKNPDEYNLFTFSLDEFYDLKKIKESLQNFSLFSSQTKLIILKSFSELKIQQKKELISFLQNQNFSSDKKTHIIFFELKEIAKDPCYKEIKKIANEKLIKKLLPAQIEKWITLKFQKENLSISSILIKKMLAYCGKDLWQIDLETEKIISWFKNQPVSTQSIPRLDSTKREDDNLNEVSENIIERICVREEEKNIFQTIETISKKDFSQAIKITSNYIEGSKNELYLLSMIAYQFKNLIKIKSILNLNKNMPINILAKKIKIHPFVLKKSLSQANKFSLKELQTIYNNILLSEINIKQGQNAKNVLESFILKTCFA